MGNYFPAFEGEPEPLPSPLHGLLLACGFKPCTRLDWFDRITRELAAPWKEN
jgi:hypothetical protein